MGKGKVNIFVLGILFLFVISFASSYSNSYVQYGPSSSYLSSQGIDLYGKFVDVKCEDSASDFVLQIAPEGCSPKVVRSDLLEEQNVPVFCPIVATNLNPTIDIKAISSMTFSGQYPKEVSGVGFHPAQAALSTKENELVNTPILHNAGYAVIVLRKNQNETSMPDFVQGNLTANIRYDVQNAFGIGPATFYLGEMEDSAWDQRYSENSFWNGKGLIRATNVDPDSATISLYNDRYSTLGSYTLNPGQTSNKIYLPSVGCLASLQIRLDELAVPESRALFSINDEYVQVRKGESFLNNRCKVKSYSNYGLTSSVQYYCVDDNKKTKNYNSFISPKVRVSVTSPLTIVIETQEEIKIEANSKVTVNQEQDISVAVNNAAPNTVEKIISVGDRITIGGKKYYLVYLDSKKGLSSVENNEDLVMWFVESATDLNDKQFLDYSNQIKGKETIKIYSKNSQEGGFILAYYNSPIVSITNKGIGSEASSTDTSGSVPESFGKALTDYNSLADTYPTVSKKSDSGVNIPTSTYSEDGLKEGITTANILGATSDRDKLIAKLLQLYPTRQNNAFVDSISKNYFSTTDANLDYVLVNGNNYAVIFKGVYEPTFDDFGAYLTVSKAGAGVVVKDLMLRKNQVLLINDSTNNRAFNVNLIKLEQEKATLSVSAGVDKAKNSVQTSEYVLDERISKSIGEYTFVITQINLKKQAKVSLIPNVDNARANSTISFKLGIDKRAIQLAPAEIQDRIDSINDTIDQWQKISDNLGKAVEGLKGACLATGALLTAKTFLTGMDGTAIARQYAMRGTDGNGGVYKYCNEMIATKVQSNMQTCLANSTTKDMITKLTAENEEILKNQQSVLKTIRGTSGITGKDWDGQEIVDDQKFLQQYSDKLGDSFTALGVPAGAINSKNSGVLGYSIQDLRTLDYCNQLKAKDPVNYNVICNKEVSEISSRINNSMIVEKGKSAGTVNAIPPQSATTKNQIVLKYRGVVKRDQVANADNFIKPEDKYFETVDINGENYFVVLNKADGGKYTVNRAYNYTNSNGRIILGAEKKAEVTKLVGAFIEGGSYDNEIDAACKVEYFGSAPDKGKPAIVPFRYTTGAGWYVAVRHATPSLGASSNYDASGAIRSYYICNAMEDRKINFNVESGVFSGGDECIGLNVVAGTIQGEAFGFTSSQMASLARTAMQAVGQAGNYDQSKKTVQITGRTCDVGNAAANIPQTQCLDFMSVEDCTLLYNVCDPVVCPSSRCNLGGNYYVNDVIQSGIFGSLLLCLPNFKGSSGDVIIPVCLSGLKAGIDGLLSVFKSYRSCLQEKLKSGKTVGICDEMYSIHLCEFFWRQVGPLTDLIVPRLLQWASGNYVRGGGEYMNVASAWQNAKDSSQFFVNQYAAGQFKLLESGTIEAIGTEVCQNFPSTGVKGDLLTSLTTPTSPPQFSGWFNEIPFTTATVPAVSQYSVYYHIYAGEEQGRYYRVYLKSPEGTTVYYSNPTITVGSGYIAAGDAADEKKDFTSPAGYKKLCIVVDGYPEECGFKEVSTDFAVDYITDKYTASQATETNITNEKQCVSGSVNLGGLINPNAQEGVASTINPDVSKSGIVRICATKDPGANTDAGRFKPVGYCGDKSITCWLDTTSVKNSIEGLGIRNEALASVSADSMNALAENTNTVTLDEFNALRKSFESQINSKASVEILNAVISNITDYLDGKNTKSLVWDYQKATFLLLRAKAYSQIALLSKSNKAVVAGTTALSFNANNYLVVNGAVSENIYFISTGGINNLFYAVKGESFSSTQEEVIQIGTVTVVNGVYTIKLSSDLTNDPLFATISEADRALILSLNGKTIGSTETAGIGSINSQNTGNAVIPSTQNNAVSNLVFQNSANGLDVLWKMDDSSLNSGNYYGTFYKNYLSGEDVIGKIYSYFFIYQDLLTDENSYYVNFCNSGILGNVNFKCSLSNYVTIGVLNTTTGVFSLDKNYQAKFSISSDNSKLINDLDGQKIIYQK